ncbi:MAG TPA: efflux RND transporter periplasmic adaptor subunit [Vicinamibacterales bacterium]|nr:efflux RND transporter periplasmic adaptor subunit [Vicinamibacterales bacterium]
MALKTCGVLLLALIAGACGGPDAPAATEPELEPLSVTQWTAKSELFAEYPPLVVGQTSRFAIHLTDISNFKPLTSGQVEVRLEGGGGAPETFRVDAPSRPGIFGVDVKPARPGARELVIALTSAALTDVHRVRAVTVYPDQQAARTAVEAAPPEAEGISFLKEQQWALDFATVLAEERAIRESIRVAAEIVARPGGAAQVVAPLDGRLVQVAALTSGSPVSQGQELARLLPPPSVPGELPQLEQARAEAAASVDLAVRDRERAERLVAAGASPQKRVDEARAIEAQALARRRAAEAQIGQYNAARSGSGAGNASGLFILRSPIAGVIASRQATTGANVAAGTTLFEVADVSQVHVAGRVPESQAAQALRTTGAEIEIPGREAVPIPGRATTLGKVLDPVTRTLPIVFPFDNRALRLPLGQSVFLRLLLEETAAKAVIPVSAVIDDAGRPIVFVHTSGESFERRPVTLGVRQAEVVQVLDGIKPGERIVSKGAHLVRLASLSTQVPAHGHVH